MAIITVTGGLPGILLAFKGEFLERLDASCKQAMKEFKGKPSQVIMKADEIHRWKKNVEAVFDEQLENFNLVSAEIVPVSELSASDSTKHYGKNIEHVRNG